MAVMIDSGRKTFGSTRNYLGICLLSRGESFSGKMNRNGSGCQLLESWKLLGFRSKDHRDDQELLLYFAIHAFFFFLALPFPVRLPMIISHNLTADNKKILL